MRCGASAIPVPRAGRRPRAAKRSKSGGPARAGGRRLPAAPAQNRLTDALVTPTRRRATFLGPSPRDTVRHSRTATDGRRRGS
jgi:hypothetical protein